MKEINKKSPFKGLFFNSMDKEYHISVIGMGYVGFPLALAFSEYYPVVGFDVKQDRINELQNNIDSNLEHEFVSNDNLLFSNTIHDIQDSNIYIVTVPTPIKEDNSPDLTYLESASKMIASYINKGDIVIYESTVYPGVTEDFCVPILEKESKLIFNCDFFCGYSPERISPGSTHYKLHNIVKITSGSTDETAEEIDQLYKKIIKKGTYKAPSIKIAEASKIIENTQRDVNIAFMNEIAMMFDKMNINTEEVLLAARTKWNFLDFRPGLVGGHCIGVDPYYLVYQAGNFNFKADLILKSREINDNITDFLIFKTKQVLEKYRKETENPKVLILGYTFKENCPDTRNTRVQDLILGLENNSINVYVYDPFISSNLHTNFVRNPLESEEKYDAIIVAVAHNEFKMYSKSDFQAISEGKLVLLDIKGLYNYSTWKL